MDWTPMFPIKIAIKWVVNPPIFQTHLYNSIYQCWWYIPSHSPKYPLWSSQITQFNYLSVALPPHFGRLSKSETWKEATCPSPSPHRASCRQLLLVSTRLSFQWISDKISNQENIGHLTDAKPWKTRGKTIFEWIWNMNNW